MVKFISYNGEYPCLCLGTLKLEINGEKVEWKNCLESGGSTYFDNEWNGYVTSGDWSVDVPSEYAKYKAEIEKVVNENVEYGCCGGCL